MQGKTVLVTGATNGIGAITARELARQGAHVVLVSRSPERCEATVKEIQQATGSTQVEYIAADLSALAGIRSVAETFLAKNRQLHVLINNAGGVFASRKLSPDGYEMSLALNHLSYFLLTHLLLDTLKATAASEGEARIINVSSDAHQAAPRGITFDDLQRNRSYSAFGVYGESKLMNIMFTFELAERLHGTHVTTNVLHPGFVRTGFGKNNNALMSAIMNVIQLFALTPEQGAKTTLYLATSPQVKGVTGKYFDKSRPVHTTSVAHDETQWRRLWQVSEQLTGLTAPV
jgi:retinol dehydrogenase 12